MSNKSLRGIPANAGFIPQPEVDPNALTREERSWRLDIASRLNAAIDHCERKARLAGDGATVAWIKETLWRTAGMLLKAGAWAVAAIEKFLGWIKQKWNDAKLTNRIVEAWRSFFMNPPIETAKV